MENGICSKCNGTGWYSYDHNHSTVCEKCCPHDGGWWELTDGYAGYVKGADNRCCRNGCGTMFRDLKDEY
jgi:hypothetical protein